MARYIARRTAQLIVLFVIFLTLTFLLLTALPGDAVKQRFSTNPNIPPEAAQLAIERLGLDKPLWEQYTGYMSNFFRGDFGFSFIQYPRPVSEIILERLPRTLVLFLVVVVSYYTLGFLAGKFIAWRRGQRGEHVLTISSVFLYTVFYPWFALMLIWFFAFYADVVPINKFLDPQEWVDAPFSSNHVFMVIFVVLSVACILTLTLWIMSRRIREPRVRKRVVWGGNIALALILIWFWYGSDFGSMRRLYAGDIAHHMVLPVVTLTLISFAGVMLLTRSSMLETMSEDFILTARAKGLAETVVRDRHAGVQVRVVAPGGVHRRVVGIRRGGHRPEVPGSGREGQTVHRGRPGGGRIHDPRHRRPRGAQRDAAQLSLHDVHRYRRHPDRSDPLLPRPAQHRHELGTDDRVGQEPGVLPDRHAFLVAGVPGRPLRVAAGRRLLPGGPGYGRGHQPAAEDAVMASGAAQERRNG